ncbi:MAG TPA: arginine deiminase-related protein [Edaphobacter sp.]
MSTQPIDLATVVPQLAVPRPAYLMCRPTFYEVDYIINPWMAGNVHASSRELAFEQWHHLYRQLTAIADVELIDPQPGLPDMVFTANAGLERNGTVVLSSFFYPERQGEERYFRNWFQSSGYKVIEIPREIPFEGEGDALFAADGSRLWAAHGPRSVPASHHCLAHAWNIEAVSLHLTDPRFYHLDTCFAPLEDDFILYYPQAFDPASLAKIEAFYPPAKRIVVSEADAVRFACNAISIDHTIILNCISEELANQLEVRGFNVVQVELGEFLKAGGAAKCLVLRLSPPKV